VKQCSRMTRRLVGVAIWVGLLSLAGCMLLQPRIVVDFEATPVSGREPQLVDFAPIVEGDVATYEWDFGDGTTSTEAAPAHIYRAAGRYTVSLLVQFADGKTTETIKADLIEVAPKLRQAAPVGLLYWLNRGTGTIHSGARVGGDVSTVVSGIYEADSVAVGAGKVYWTSQYKVERAGLDGSGRETIFYQAGLPLLKGIAVDESRAKLYWISQPASWDEEGAIWKADLDGGQARVWATKAEWENDTWVPSLLAIDSVNGRLYWFERYLHVDFLPIPASLPQSTAVSNCSVHWTDLNSFNDHLIFGNLPDSKGLALDVGLPVVGARYVYWTNPESDRVTRCKTDGTEYAWMLNNIDDPIALAIDAKEGKIYWSGSEGIHRANLDGTEQELIYPGVRANAIALDL
jgi:PKD repeat protein